MATDANGKIISEEDLVEFTLTPSGGDADCTLQTGAVPGTWGLAADNYPYIFYGNLSQDKYPVEACEPYYHKNATIDTLRIQVGLEGENGTGQFDITASEVDFSGNLDIEGSVYVGAGVNLITLDHTTGTISGTIKNFKIPHPTKENKVLVHTCLEGPENGVYIRGRLTNKSIIELPEYWSGLVDPETITVSLTQIGTSQDLMVEKIEWGKKIYIKSGNGTGIDCYYIINATRKDVPPLEVEQDA